MAESSKVRPEGEYVSLRFVPGQDEETEVFLHHTHCHWLAAVG